MGKLSKLKSKFQLGKVPEGTETEKQGLISILFFQLKIKWYLCIVIFYQKKNSKTWTVFAPHATHDISSDPLFSVLEFSNGNNLIYHKNLSTLVLNMAKYTIILLILTYFVPIFFLSNLFQNNIRGSFRFKKSPKT